MLVIEHHTVERFLDRDRGLMIFFCRECAFAEIRDARTLERTWRRAGEGNVHHSGGAGLGLDVAGSRTGPPAQDSAQLAGPAGT